MTLSMDSMMTRQPSPVSPLMHAGGVETGGHGRGERVEMTMTGARNSRVPWGGDGGKVVEDDKVLERKGMVQLQENGGKREKGEKGKGRESGLWDGLEVEEGASKWKKAKVWLKKAYLDPSI